MSPSWEVQGVPRIAPGCSWGPVCRIIEDPFGSLRAPEEFPKEKAAEVTMAARRQRHGEVSRCDERAREGWARAAMRRGGFERPLARAPAERAAQRFAGMKCFCFRKPTYFQSFRLRKK